MWRAAEPVVFQPTIVACGPSGWGVPVSWGTAERLVAWDDAGSDGACGCEPMAVCCGGGFEPGMVFVSRQVVSQWSDAQPWGAPRPHGWEESGTWIDSGTTAFEGEWVSDSMPVDEVVEEWDGGVVHHHGEPSTEGWSAEVIEEIPAEGSSIHEPELVPTVMESELAPEAVRPLPPQDADDSSVLVPDVRPEVAPVAPPETPVMRSPAPVVHDPLTMESPDATGDRGTEAVEEPIQPAVEPEPVNLFEAEDGAEAAVEPTRRWIHARGDRSLVGRLVGLPNADTCVLETEGRRITVPLEKLSDHDRRYVGRTVERLAAARAAARPLETAGL